MHGHMLYREKLCNFKKHIPIFNLELIGVNWHPSKCKSLYDELKLNNCTVLFSVHVPRLKFSVTCLHKFSVYSKSPWWCVRSLPRYL
jgi:hypothetical protein